jgi:hypothetical protein
LALRGRRLVDRMNVALRGHGTWCVAKKVAITVGLCARNDF